MEELADVELPYPEADAKNLFVRDDKKRQCYSDALINNGGISTDAFVSSLGIEETRAFYDNVLFKAE